MREYIKALLKNQGLTITDVMCDQLVTYRNLLVEWNEKMNLTNITEEKEVAEKHFADCASILATSYCKEKKSVIDVGTGAGFPGMVLKVLNPEISLTLLDSLAKRISFLDEVVQSLGLQGVITLHSRAEDAAQNPAFREKFDIATARAVASLPVLLEYCLPFVRVGGLFIAMKGTDPQEEIAQSEKALQILNAKVKEVIPVSIADFNHSLIIIEKTGQTPKKYPRKAGMPTKSPL